MTIYSAAERRAELGDAVGYCAPLAIDSMFRHTELPPEFYEKFYAEGGSGGSHNRAYSYLLQEFYGVEPQETDGEKASLLATFTAFGGSPQSYFPDVPYEYPELIAKTEKLSSTLPSDRQITHSVRRLEALLNQARNLRCLVLATVSESQDEFIPHAVGLDMIEQGNKPLLQKYVVRNMGKLATDRIYGPQDFSGLIWCAKGVRSEYAPLPDCGRAYFPPGQTSWEIAVLPPEPGN